MKDIVFGTPVKDASVRVCNQLDVDCASPLPFGPFRSNAQGKVAMVIPLYFTGYSEATSPGIVPTLLYDVTRGYRSADFDLAADNPLNMISPSALSVLAGQLKSSVDPERGHVFLRAADCRSLTEEGSVAPTTAASAAGVSVTADPVDAATVLFYTSGSLPSTAAKSTDASGQLGFGNVRPGFFTVNYALAATGRRVGSLTFFVRKGWATYGTLVPTRLRPAPGTLESI